MAANDVLFRLNSPLLLAGNDLLQTDDDGDRRHDEGAIAWVGDKFGRLRLFSYRKNISGSAFAAGDLTSRSVEIESNQTGTATTSSTGSFSGADEHIGSLFIVHDDAGGAGGAPEGEATIVASNTATVATFETDLPLSTALAANDDVTLISPKIIDAAANDFNWKVCGVAMAAIPDDDWGWVQFQGLHPRVQHKTTLAAAVGDAMFADTAAVASMVSSTAILAGGTSAGLGLVVGFQLSTHGSDALQIKSPVMMTLWPTYL